MNKTNFILKYIGKEKLEEIDLYVLEILQENFKEFQRQEDMEILMDYKMNFVKKLDLDEIDNLKAYTGIDFRKINSILRDCWDYEVNGALTPLVKEYSLKQANNIKKILMKNDELPIAMKTFRGVSLASFFKYGIQNINELTQLEGKYIYEEGFTSTTLLKENSFFNKKSDWGNISDVEIECLIPSGSDDGVLVNSDILSYSPNQEEYLINSGSLFKIVNVNVNNEKNVAKIQMVLIPKKIWNYHDYNMEKSAVLEQS